MVWLHRDPERDKLTTDEIDKAEDRSAAIMAAAYFEDRLTLAIRTQLIGDDEIADPLFKGRGQLSDFATKVDFAYLLGLLSKRQWRRLNTIRTIRNDFAHNLEPISFGTQSIRDRCKK